MTITVNLENIAHEISNINVPGINFRDIDGVPESALPILPVVFPAPDNFITDLEWTRDSYGSDDVAKMSITYTLHYRYLHAVIGSGGGLLSVYSSMIANIVKILSAIFADSNYSGAIDLTLLDISNIGPMSDPAGETQYHGMEFSLKVLEFIQ